MRVHQSLLNDCLRAMQYNVELPVYHGGSVRAVGTGYHKSLETYYGERIETGVVTPEGVDILRLVKIGWAEFDRVASGGESHTSEAGRERGSFNWDPDVPDRETAHQIIAQMVGSYFEGHFFWPADWTVLGTELKIDLPWRDGHTRGGSIDLVLQDTAGFIVGDDHKTTKKNAWAKGKESPRKNQQAGWYTWALKELFPDGSGHRFAFSIMSHAGKFERRVSDPGPEHIAATERRMLETVGMYELVRAAGRDLPANPSSTLCSPRYCDWWSICPHGAAIDG